MKKFCLGCFILLASGLGQVEAQNTHTTSKVSTVNQKNSIRNVDAIYEIRLGAFLKGVPVNAYEDLKDLGILKIVIGEENGMEYVYLGSYMGKTTANKILSIVKSRGHKTAYLEKVKDKFVDADGREMTHTYQFCSVNKLDMRKVGNVLSTDVSMIDKLFISYDGKNYQMSLGLTAPELRQEINQYRSFAVAHGFETSFLRTFRQAPKGYVAPATEQENTLLMPMAEVNSPTSTAGDKASKMSGGTTATATDKASKMSGGTTTVTSNNNTMPSPY